MIRTGTMTVFRVSRLTARVVLACIGLMIISPLASAQQAPVTTIKVPYGLSWGDSVEKIRDMIGAVKARETSFTQKGPGKTSLEAEGLAIGDPLLRKTVFTLRGGSLVEVELQYGNPNWDAEKTTDFFDRTRRRIDERYGAGTLLVNKVREHPSGENTPGDMTYTLIIYQWTQPMAALELSYYAAEEQSSSAGTNNPSCRVVSLHYKTP